MPTYGVTEDGFVIKPYEAIVDSLKTLAQTYLGADLYLGEFSRILRFIQAIAYGLDEYWQQLEYTYYSKYIDFAFGPHLEHVVAEMGFTKLAAQKATGIATFSRSTPAPANITIPAGTRIETEDGTVQFKTSEVVILEEAGTEVEADIEALVAGEDGNVAQNTITVIVDSVSGIEEVINDAATENGTDVEEDDELRLRAKTNFAVSGKGSFDAILANLREVSNVIAATLEQNDTNGEVDGIPAHAIRATVFGGDDDDIAQAIFDTKATGIESKGDGVNSGTATDQDGIEYEIDFRRPDEVAIYASADITTDGTEITEADVEAAVMGYINTLTIGADVIFNKVVAAIMVIPGITDVTLLLDTVTPPVDSANIEIDGDEIARTDADKISVS